MALIWSGVPVFGTQGQVLSASAHLDALSTATNHLYDRVVGGKMPFSGGILWGEGTLYYMIKHTSNTLHWKIDFKGRVRLHVNGVQVVSIDSTTDTSRDEDIDLTSLNLTVGQIYSVNVQIIEYEGPMTFCRVRVWSLYQRTSRTYPTLAAFTDGTTPTLQNWQDVSTYATRLHEDTSMPTPTMACSYGEAVSGSYPGDRGYGWFGSLVYGGGQLFIRALTTRSTTPDPTPTNGIVYSCDMKVYINGTLAGTFLNQGGGDPGKEKLFEEFFNPASYSATLGSEYTVRITFETVANDAFMGARYEVQNVVEVAQANPSLSGYTAMADWTHGDYVYGSTGSKRVKWIVDNLVAIKSAMSPRVYATLANRQVDDWNETWAPLSMVRKHRFLKYYVRNDSPDNNGDGEPDTASPTVEIKWDTGRTLPNGDKVWNSTTLEDATNKWMTFDLSSQDGIWPGVQYRIYGASWAFEES